MVLYIMLPQTFIYVHVALEGFIQNDDSLLKIDTFLKFYLRKRATLNLPLQCITFLFFKGFAYPFLKGGSDDTAWTMI